MIDDNPCEVYTYPYRTIWGGTIHCGRRTGAHLDHLRALLHKNHPGYRLLILQGPYSTGIAASAGTHDYDCVWDLLILDLNGNRAPGDFHIKFFRSNGFHGWWRTPPTFPYHFHGMSLHAKVDQNGTCHMGGCRVGIYIPGQVTDIYNHAFGLSEMHTPGSDRSWYPDNIHATIFNYTAYLEDKMEFNDWSKASKEALVDAVVAGLLGADVKRDPDVVVTAREALVRAYNTPDILRAQQKDPS